MLNLECLCMLVDSSPQSRSVEFDVSLHFYPHPRYYYFSRRINHVCFCVWRDTLSFVLVSLRSFVPVSVLSFVSVMSYVVTRSVCFCVFCVFVVCVQSCPVSRSKSPTPAFSDRIAFFFLPVGGLKRAGSAESVEILMALSKRRAVAQSFLSTSPSLLCFHLFVVLLLPLCVTLTAHDVVPSVSIACVVCARVLQVNTLLCPPPHRCVCGKEQLMEKTKT